MQAGDWGALFLQCRCVRLLSGMVAMLPQGPRELIRRTSTECQKAATNVGFGRSATCTCDISISNGWDLSLALRDFVNLAMWVIDPSREIKNINFG